MYSFFNIEHIVSVYGYLGIFIIIFLESGIFFALPGDSLLFTVGLLTPVFNFNLFSLILVICMATFLGGIFGYEIGFYIEKLRKFVFFRKILKEEYINKTHKFFEDYGKSSFLFYRFVPIVRTFMPILAGITKLPIRIFAKYSLAGSLLWSISITCMGYFLGRIFPEIQNYLWVIAIIVVMISLTPILFEMLKKHSKV